MNDGALIRRLLLRWYDEQQRDLPWRENADPYRIWVSEVMLQQTRAATAEPYFARWVERFPTLDDLAEASEEQVLAIWSGLGYYARARNFHRAARIVRDRHAGEIPADVADLRALPGVGEYTAGAIASIAFGKRATAIDGNARRVLCRLFDLASALPGVLRSRAAALVDPDRPGDFNQALMELGATLCTPRSPGCPACPLAPACRSRARGTQAERPRPRRRSRPPLFRVGTAVIVSPSGRVHVARRPPRGLLGGLWEFPGAVTRPDEEPCRAARRALAASLGRAARDEEANPVRMAPIRHAYTHRHHEYHPFRFRTGSEPALPPVTDPSDAGETGVSAWTEAAWVGLDELTGLPLSAAQRRIAALVAGDGSP